MESGKTVGETEVIDVVRAIADLDGNPHLHSARLLLLLTEFSKGKHGHPVEGLTKLAKLDFLLRYPIMLDRALRAKGRSTAEVNLEEHEKLSVESQMVRYRFGPWDHRYREFLNILVGKGLANIHEEGRKIVISVTPEGQAYASRISTNEAFEPYVRRAKVLRRNFDLQATTLMKFVYDTFPEVLSLRSNQPIVA